VIGPNCCRLCHQAEVQSHNLADLRTVKHSIFSDLFIAIRLVVIALDTKLLVCCTSFLEELDPACRGPCTESGMNSKHGLSWRRVDSTTSCQPDNTLRKVLCKMCHLTLALFCARVTSEFAIAHARPAQQIRWNAVLDTVRVRGDPDHRDGNCQLTDLRYQP
jgi:hypothetical protein